MKVRFIVDYRGKLTDEEYYQVGEVGDFPPLVANKLINDRRAKRVVVRKARKKK